MGPLCKTPDCLPIEFPVQLYRIELGKVVFHRVYHVAFESPCFNQNIDPESFSILLHSSSLNGMRRGVWTAQLSPRVNFSASYEPIVSLIHERVPRECLERSYHH